MDDQSWADTYIWSGTASSGSQTGCHLGHMNYNACSRKCFLRQRQAHLRDEASPNMAFIDVSCQIWQHSWPHVPLSFAV